MAGAKTTTVTVTIILRFYPPGVDITQAPGGCIPDSNTMIEAFQRNWINLASTRLGARAICATDDFFAPVERLLDDTDPVFIEGKFDDNGKWMDGWESRRKREPGHDYCIVELCRPGSVHGIVIDTRHFTGNYAPAASIDACYLPDSEPNEKTQWHEMVSSQALQGDSQQAIEISDQSTVTHLRLNIYPDGGVARLRVYGTAECNWNEKAGQVVDLASALNGGRALVCNDQHFGHMSNILSPGRGINMGDGWETRRRREPGFDWVIIALGHEGIVKSIEIDTAHFKGNFPHQCSISATCLKNVDESNIADQSLFWQELLPRQAMQMDHIHKFEEEILAIDSITHLRLNLHPDGGISRLRVYGTVSF